MRNDGAAPIKPFMMICVLLHLDHLSHWLVLQSVPLMLENTAKGAKIDNNAPTLHSLATVASARSSVDAAVDTATFFR